jgi:diguanylate cyclase (GGDEF)-like protein/PAS domain S-box-containing protein
VDRFYAMTAVGPRLLVTVGIGIGEYLAPWWRHMAGLASLVMLAAGIAIALSTRLRRVLKHEVRMRRSLEDLTFDLQNLRQAIDLHAMVSITDESGHFIRANAKFCEVMHLPEQALLGRHQRIFHSGVHPRAFFDEIRTQLQDKGVFHGSLCERDRLGQLHWFDITTVAVRDSSDGAGRLISLRTDVSASRKVVQRLQRSLDVTQASKDAMDEAAHTDALTSLPNRRAFDEAATRLLRKSRDENLPAALLLLDVDWFKKYNDTLGHAAGDEALREVAGALKGALRRAGDQVYRYGGEEFAVLVAASAEADVWSIAQSLRVAVANMGLSHPVHPEGKVTVSMGYQIIRGASTPASVEAWIESADRALYKAKRDGRNRCVQAEDAEAGSGS